MIPGLRYIYGVCLFYLVSVLSVLHTLLGIFFSFAFLEITKFALVYVGSGMNRSDQIALLVFAMIS